MQVSTKIFGKINKWGDANKHWGEEGGGGGLWEKFKKRLFGIYYSINLVNVLTLDNFL